MRNTYARPVRDLRNNYNEIITLANDGNQVIITQNGREAVVVIGKEAYKEYEQLLHRQYINQELLIAKEMAQDPKTKWLSEKDFWDIVEADL
ncbi:MAG: type II toxin-antitoxin system Phd/YefM family antitoxin [Oscillospiraceae bacterium]|jgi:prevent-host-death family protein|nr:type II toxin-antitoxin system Phd/YefM family antitoxin [Oscillospiraceae bacterium]